MQGGKVLRLSLGLNTYEAAAMDIKITQLTPLNEEPRTVISTAEAAKHLNRAEQTLRLWACKEVGALRPRRIHGRLAWPVADIRRLVECGHE